MGRGCSQREDVFAYEFSWQVRKGRAFRQRAACVKAEAGNSMVSSENSVYHYSITFRLGPGEGGRGQVTKGFEHSVKEFGPYPVGTEVLFRNF